MAQTPLPGYPQPVGEKYGVMFDHSGPTSYNNTGTYATSGALILANGSGLNFGGFDGIWPCGDSQDGLYFVVLIPVNGGNGNAVPSYRIHWFVRASGAEVANGVNLSASKVRLKALMV